MLRTAKQWVEGWQRAIDAASRHGADSYRLEIDRPATRQEVDQVEETIARPLPDQLRRALLDFSRRVDFFWFLPDGARPPEPIKGVFCGSCSWDIGRLAGMYDEARWLASNAFVEDTPDERLWDDKLPFHGIGNGDFIAIDIRANEAQSVVYLSHELAFSHGYVLGADFIDFMDRWSAIGCPDDDIWPLFFPKTGRCIDVGHPNVAIWCDWFGIPRPV